MARLNTAVKKDPIFTHEGGKAAHINAEQELRRTVMSCLLWEDTFYENGVSIADRIKDLSQKVKPAVLSEIAIEAREKQHLRHVPLLLTALLCQTGSGSSIVSDTIFRVIQRADELAEFVAVYAQVNGVHPSQVKKKLSAQAKKGLARAFNKFSAYSLAKYNRDGAVKLRDVLFMCHAAPATLEQVEIWKKLVEGELESPDTWEVALSKGSDKKETFTRLLQEEKLGYLALLRNLRGMLEAGVDEDLITQTIEARKGGAEKVLPFRFVAAARHAPRLENAINASMGHAILDMPKFEGKTAVLVDVSGSMDAKLSAKSDLSRMDAAAALASIVNCDKLRVFTFSNDLVEVPARRGMSGIDAVINSQGHGGTNFATALSKLNKEFKYERLIVITDEQSHDGGYNPLADSKGYLINVATYKNGIGYKNGWTHIDGFSENVVKYIYETERVGKE